MSVGFVAQASRPREASRRARREWPGRITRLPIVVGGVDEQAQWLLPAPDEVWRVQDWRLGELLRVGYDLTSASMLAVRVDVDWHEAAGLLRAGCDAETATRILL